MVEKGFKSFSSVSINCGSTGVLHVVGSPTYRSRTKHNTSQVFFLCELSSSSKIIIGDHVSMQQMLADCATKYQAKPQQLDSILQHIKGFTPRTDHLTVARASSFLG